MVTRKPDWAQRMVQRHVGVEDSEPENYRAVMLPAKQVEFLLRAHQRKVKRVVRQARKESLAYNDSAYNNGVARVAYSILRKLKELER